MFDLAGKVCVVTGSTRGIGKSVALALAKRGGKVVISSRKATACDEVASEINSICGSEAAIAISASIGAKDQLQNLVDATVARLGGLDVLVCNAASNPAYGPMSELEDDQFRKLLENNILATHWLVQMASPHMIKRGGGSIIIMSSIGGMRGSMVIGGYNVTKAADLQIVRNMAQELGPHGIRVNAISPGLIKTDFAKSLWDNPELLEKFKQGSALRSIGAPEDIAGAAVFLASEESRFVTGHNLVVDGGVTIMGD
ncbi:SDR family oxidoreductase [Sphingobium sp. JS3065]|uniref:SDR family NAD(P)-dependent oxidoreductase n=1 Tax=Sphingobium sp. JS3065 TaxID=2970925 RepID=UPI0022647DF3|nr:SDR family oxidoreductase [Sphingobium sp. JS3065]UZW56436.1 SDR family oxidoreductase [Sphingobium sp. JS3065]